MDWLWLCVGFSAGLVCMALHYHTSEIGMECKRLDREIAADKLRRAQEERRTEALRLIQRNTEEARRNG